MKYRPLLWSVPLATCALVFFACSDDATTTVPGATDAGNVDARTPGPTKPIGDDDTGDDDTGDDDDDDAGTPDASPPKDAGKDADASPPPPPQKRVFVTKAKFTGDLKTAGGGANGAEGADKLCEAAATAANLGGGGWTAWVSVSGKNALDRIQGAGPWYLVNRTTLVFNSNGSLTSAPLHAIDMNETGTSVVAGSGGPLANRVWTGTQNTGVEVAGKSCADWTDGTTASSAVAGAFRETASWSRYALQPNEGCETPWPIYCFEQ